MQNKKLHRYTPTYQVQQVHAVMRGIHLKLVLSLKGHKHDNKPTRYTDYDYNLN